MDFGFTEDEEDFRARVRMLLREPPISNEVARVGGSAAEPDERVLYRSLGAAGLLGVSWPRELGGQDRSAVELLIVTEELVRAGIPDTLYVNSILTVGNLILSQGTDELKRRLLPGLAAGRLFASILYSEPEARISAHWRPRRWRMTQVPSVSTVRRFSVSRAVSPISVFARFVLLGRIQNTVA
jgi:alkylation response protein AidB-like acyl-CoA dehydrogenase